jgi:hypothetical protein
MRVLLHQENVYGKAMLYPANNYAVTFAKLLNKVTLNMNDVAYIKELGFEVALVPKVNEVIL